MKQISFLLLLFLFAAGYGQRTYLPPAVPEELSDAANSILLEESVEVDVSDISRRRVKTRRVWMILNREGISDAPMREYTEDNSKVRNMEARIYDDSGKRIARFRTEDFHDVSRSGDKLYSDSRMLYRNFSPVSFPYVIIYESDVESGDTAFINTWQPLKAYGSATLKSTFTIHFDPSNPVRFKAENLDGLDVLIEEKPGAVTFSAGNLSPIRYERFAPSSLKIFPIVYFALDSFQLKGREGSAASWKELGKWFDEELLGDVGEISEVVKARIRNMVAKEPTNEAKARRIYQYLQDKVRYVNIQIGIGGWKPMPAAEVEQFSYGDCKALTNYTKVLLDAVGIPSYFTILYSSSQNRDIMEDFVSIQGNHAILGIPDGDRITWLECTSRHSPFGYLGTSLEDRNVLMITPEGGKIVRVEAYRPEDNFQKTTGSIVLNPSGAILAEMNRITKGSQYELRYFLNFKSPDEVDSYYKNEWQYINGLSVFDIDFENDREEIVFTEKLKLKSENYTNPVSGGFLFAPNVFNQGMRVPPRMTDRKQDLEISYGYRDVDEIEIEIPESFVVDGLPEPVELKTRFGAYKVEFSLLESGNIQYLREVQIEKGVFPPSDYEEFREFRREISRMDQMKILIRQQS